LTANQTWSFASGAAMLSLSGSGAINNEGFTLTLGTPDVNTLAGNITGAGEVTSTGAGTLTFSGMNTYLGGTVFSAGTLKLGSSGALGTSGPLVFNGGTLQYSVNNTTDYSGRFSTADNQAYSIDTKAQNVTFASSLVSSGHKITAFHQKMFTYLQQENMPDLTVIYSGVTPHYVFKTP
jgi:fibronectin-binding autotransporter adhesin